MNNNSFRAHIVHITDTFDDNAKAKITSAYAKHTEAHNVWAQAEVLPAADSFSVGTKASELVNNTERPNHLILALNFAPPDKDEGTENNHRNDFFCADMGNGVVACGTSNGLEFSYIKPLIKSFYRLTNTNSLDSQFRSLQILPKHAVLFALPELREHLIAENIFQRLDNLDDYVPTVPDVTHVLEVDNFHNVKLYPSRDDVKLLRALSERRDEILFAFGRASIEINARPTPIIEADSPYTALAAPTLFAAPLGTNVIAARSSSTLSGGKDVPMIATIRANPASTRPAYHPHLPKVGFPVHLRRALYS